MKQIIYCFENRKKIIAILIFFISICSTGYSQQIPGGFKSLLDVKDWYKGWQGDPDTLKVFMDSTFTAAERDSLQKAIDRWNNAGAKPKMKKVASPPADITVTTDDNLDAGTDGETSTTYNPGTGKASKAKIRVNPDHPGIGLAELLTHELGHALGLLDTDEDANPDDVMKGAGANGSGGNLSSHDSAEIKSAATAQVVEKKHAMVPSGPAVPGQLAMLQFALDQTYPPSIASQAIINILPIMNMYLTIVGRMVVGNIFYMDVMLNPQHWSGRFYFDVSILFPAPYNPLYFMAWHYAHTNPVPATTFTCPFEYMMLNQVLYVYWRSLCTYPFTGALRSQLTVDNNTVYENKGGGTYVLELGPGTHTLTLDVDDYMGNSASSTQDVVITGTGDLQDEGSARSGILAYPNPFRNTCSVKCDPKASVEILNMTGHVVDRLPAGISEWTPDPALPSGTYILKATSAKEIKYGKVVYLK